MPLDRHRRSIAGTHDLLAQLVDAVAVVHTGPGIVDGWAVVFRVDEFAEVVLVTLDGAIKRRKELKRLTKQ